MNSLKRNITNSVTTKMIPTFELDITKPGTNCVYLNSYKCQGKGIADTKNSITNYIEVAITSGAVVKDLATGSLPFKNLFKLYSQTVKLKKSSDEYINNNDILLSRNNNKVMKASFESPISLKVSGDYFKSAVLLTASPSSSGTKTQMKVVFSMKFKN